MSPWAIPPKQIIPIMQIMWDAFFDNIPQEIMATGMIYQLVSNSNICPTEYHTFSIQAMQRVSDSWRSPIGSMAIMVLITFFNSDMELSTNEDRQEWATWYLDKFHFAYKEADGNDKLVCTV